MIEHRPLFVIVRNAFIVTGLVVVVAVAVGMVAWRWWGAYRPALVAVALFSVAVHAAAACVVWLFVHVVSWRILPAGITRPYDTHRVRYGFRVLASLAFMGVALLVINKLWLPAKLHPASLTADVTIMLVSMVLGLALVSGSRRAWAGFGAGVAIAAVLVSGVSLAFSEEGAAPASRASIKSLTTLPYLTWVPTEDGERSRGDLSRQYRRVLPVSMSIARPAAPSHSCSRTTAAWCTTGRPKVTTTQCSGSPRSRPRATCSHCIRRTRPRGS